MHDGTAVKSGGEIRENGVKFCDLQGGVAPAEKQEAILGVLKQDPRPAYDTDETRVYGVEFAGYDVHFTVVKDLLTVKELIKLSR